MRRLCPLLAIALVAVVALPFGAHEREAPTSGHSEDHAVHRHAALAQTLCWPSTTPLGAVAPALPIWCSGPLASGPSSAIIGANTWADDWDVHLSNATLGPNYQAFALGSINQSMLFRHNDHWMVDVNGLDRSPADGPHNRGGVVVRPSAAFHFLDGQLAVEVDAAAGIADYATDAWPEIIVTTAPSPSQTPRATSGGLYAYDYFPGAFTVGCRLQSDRSPICALYDNTSNGPASGGRVWELSFFQCGNHYTDACATKVGGSTVSGQGGPWRVCRGTDPDLDCRDRFRWEITSDQLTLYVNGALYMQHSGFRPGFELPSIFLSSEVYVYFANWISSPSADTVRFHWDHLAINLPPTPVVLPTAQPRATNTPTATLSRR